VWKEAERNRVLRHGRLSVMRDIATAPHCYRFTFRGRRQNVQRGMTPRISGRSTLEARLTIPSGAEGDRRECRFHRWIRALDRR
jgi:hypothetical protein